MQWVVGIALVVLVTCGGIGWYAVNRIRTAVKETLDDPQFVEKMLGPQRKQIAPEVMRGLPVEAELTMDELSIALKADWKAVESKYGGKIVEVSGTVSNLTPKSSIVGSNVASLKADKSDSVGSLHCQLAESNPFARLTPEMPVTLKGEFTGGGILEDAIIVKTGSDLAVSTTAEDFLKAHAPYLGADLPDEFRDQWFRVTGQIERIDTKELAIFLKGDGQYTIQCHMQLTHSNLAELNLHVGDTIHVLGKLSRFIIHDESSVPLNLCILYVAEPHDNPP
ncbi:MAG: OB-fold protein [Planctomycetales bacterium]